VFGLEEMNMVPLALLGSAFVFFSNLLFVFVFVKKREVRSSCNCKRS
jgi:hypothetical protein